MYYTLVVLLIWLLLGAERLTGSFNPTLVAFIIAIVVDLIQNRGLLIKR